MVCAKFRAGIQKVVSHHAATQWRRPRQVCSLTLVKSISTKPGSFIKTIHHRERDTGVWCNSGNDAELFRRHFLNWLKLCLSFSSSFFFFCLISTHQQLTSKWLGGCKRDLIGDRFLAAFLKICECAVFPAEFHVIVCAMPFTWKLLREWHYKGKQHFRAFT